MTTTTGQQATGCSPWAVVTCVTAACSRCGTTREDEEHGYTVHYASTSQARSSLAEAGWRFTPEAGGGEALLCGGCAAKADCGRLGHQPETSGPTPMPDGRVLPRMTFCGRCDVLLEREGDVLPAPEGYPAPAGAHWVLPWDAAALPAGNDIAGAAWRLITRLSDDASAARWDAWDGDQKWRPGRIADPDPEADKAAALTLIKAAHGLFCAAAGAGASVPAVP
jgi:hypothetical protein